MSRIFARSKGEGLQAYRRWRQSHGEMTLEELRFSADELPVHREEPPKPAQRERGKEEDWRKAFESRLLNKGYPDLSRNHRLSLATSDPRKKEKSFDKKGKLLSLK